MELPSQQIMSTDIYNKYDVRWKNAVEEKNLGSDGKTLLVF